MDKIAFMVMPFGDETALQAYTHCIKGVCQEYGLDIRRADEIFGATIVWEDIVNEIRGATVVIVDISGRNANVFYELGMAHVLRQSQTIIITHEAYEATPFDVAHFRILRYENTYAGKAEFEVQLRKTLDVLLQDLKTVYKDEFALVEHVMVTSRGEQELGTLVGLANTPHPVRAGEPWHVCWRSPHLQEEFAYTETGPVRHYDCEKRSASLMPIRDSLPTTTKLGYVEFVGDIAVLTPKGSAFASFLSDHGWVCHFLCGQTLTPGFALEPE